MKKLFTLLLFPLTLSAAPIVIPSSQLPIYTGLSNSYRVIVVNTNTLPFTNGTITLLDLGTWMQSHFATVVQAGTGVTVTTNGGNAGYTVAADTNVIATLSAAASFAQNTTNATNTTSIFRLRSGQTVQAETMPNWSESGAKSAMATPMRMFNSWFAYGNSFTETNLLQIMTNYTTYGFVPAGWTNLVVDAGWATNNANGLIVGTPGKFNTPICSTIATLNSNGFTFGAWIGGHGVADPSFVPAFTSDASGTNYNLVYTNAYWAATSGIAVVKFDGLEPYFHDQGPIIRSAYEQANKRVAIYGNAISAGGVFLWNSLRTYNAVRGGSDDVTSDVGFFLGDVDRQFSIVPHIRAAKDWPAIEINNGWYSLHDKVGLAYAALLPATVESSVNSGAWGFTTFYYTNLDVADANFDTTSFGRIIAITGGKATNTDSISYYTGTVIAARPQRDGTHLVGLFNRTSSGSSNITFNAKSLRLPVGPITVRDLFAQSFVDYITNGLITYTVGTNDCKLLKLYSRKVNPFEPGVNWLSDYEWNHLSFSNSVSSLNGAVSSGGLWQPQFNTNSQWGQPLAIGGVTYTNGVQLSPNGGLTYWLGGHISTVGFTVGLDDYTKNQGVADANTTNVVTFYTNDVAMFVITNTSSSSPATVSFDVTGVNTLRITCIELNTSLFSQYWDRIFADVVNFYAMASVTQNYFTPIPLPDLRLGSGLTLNNTFSPSPHYWDPNLSGAQNSTISWRHDVQTRNETNFVEQFYLQGTTTNRFEINVGTFTFPTTGRVYNAVVKGFAYVSNGVTGPFFFTNSFPDTTNRRALEVTLNNPTNAADASTIYICTPQYRWQ